MLFRSLAVLFCSVLLYSKSTGQNLVLNPSFESVNISSLQCSWYTAASQFNNAINNWTCPTSGSTDIYHTSLAVSCYCNPNSTNGSSAGSQNPRTGNAYVNLVTYGNGGCTPYREYVQGRLSTPLVAGQTYRVEMYVTLADYSNKGTNNIGVLFTNAPFYSSSMCVYSAAPQVNYTGPIIVDKVNWTLISMCFTPTTSGLEYLTIGNFYTDASTATVSTGGSQGTIRYFLDDVSVEQATSSAMDPGTNGTLSVCQGATTVDLYSLLGGTPDAGGTWSGPSALTGGHLGTFDPAVNAAGTYTYTLSGIICGNTTVVSSTVDVSFNSGTSSAIYPAGPYCSSSGSVQLTTVSPGGSWSSSCGSCVSSSGVFDPTVAGPGTHQVMYTIAGPCGSTGTQNITVSNSLNATISSQGPLCESSSPITLTAADAGGTWTASCGACITGSGVFDPLVSGTGTFTVNYSIGGSCGDNDTSILSILPQSDATISPVTTLCESQADIILTATDAGGNWAATCGSCINSSTGAFDISSAGPGTHTVSYSIAGQCGDTDSRSFTIVAQRNASITPQSDLCATDAAVTLNTAESGGTWTSACGGCISTSGTFDPAIAGAGSHTIVYDIPGLCGDRDSIIINVQPIPSAQFISPGTLCITEPSVTLSAATAGGTWSSTCGSCIDANTGTFDPVIAGTGTHSVMYTIAGQCGTSHSEQIIVTSVNDATITAQAPLCINDPSVILQAASAGGAWTSSCGSCLSSTGEFDPSQAGQGNHVITYITPGSCGDTSNVSLNVFGPPDPEITSVPSLCLQASPFSLTASVSGGAWSGPGVTNSSSGQFDPLAAGEGTHRIFYTIPGSCGASDSIDITILPALTISSIADLTTCEGTTVTMNVSALSGTSPFAYTWTDLSGNVLSSSSQLSATPTGNISVIVTVKDACDVNGLKDTVTVSTTPIPDATFTATPLTGCAPLEVTFTATNYYAGVCNWDFGQGSTDQNCNQTSFTYQDTGCYSVRYIVDVNGCRDTSYMQDLVCVQQTPKADFTITPETATILEPTISFTNTSTGAYTYHWDFGDGDTSETKDVIHVYGGETETFLVCLQAYASGCMDSVCRNIEITDEFLFYIPNAFTPDNNGRNDLFTPVISGHVPGSYEMMIFNRWGNLVYTTKDLAKGWDGKTAQEEVYIWMVSVTSEPDNQLRKYKGTVTIVR